MKHRISVGRTAVTLLAASLLSVFADTRKIETDLSEAPPAENVLFSFEAEESPDGWGWVGLEGEWRDIGMSFRAPTDGNIQKITLRIQKVPLNFPDRSEFHLRIFETSEPGQPPSSGELVYAGKGEMMLMQTEMNSYLTFTLGENVPMKTGAIYTFVLSWEKAASHQMVIFSNNLDYQNGQTWYRDQKNGNDWKSLTQSDRPGLLFYIQGS